MTETQAALLDQAINTTQDRDRWRRLALHLETQCPDDQHCPFTVATWTARTEALQARLDTAEAALTEILLESPDAYNAITTWRHTYAPQHLATTPTPARWKELAQR
jgi:hypothetical protein